MCENCEDYPYLATWSDTIEDADKEDETPGKVGWIHWNGVSATYPNFVRYKGKTYTHKTWLKKILKDREKKRGETVKHA